MEQGVNSQQSELARHLITPQVVDHQAAFTQWMTEHEKLLRHIITGFEANVAIQDEYQLTPYQSLDQSQRQQKLAEAIRQLTLFQHSANLYLIAALKKPLI